MAEKNYQSNEQKNKQTNYTGSNQTNKETASNSKIHDKERRKYYRANKPFSGSFLIQPPYNRGQHKYVEKRCQNSENKNKH